MFNVTYKATTKRRNFQCFGTFKWNHSRHICTRANHYASPNNIYDVSRTMLISIFKNRREKMAASCFLFTVSAILNFFRAYSSVFFHFVIVFGRLKRTIHSFILMLLNRCKERNQKRMPRETLTDCGCGCLYIFVLTMLSSSHMNRNTLKRS